MNPSSLILVLSCLGIAQALFLCVYLFTLKKGNRPAHRFLGLLILGLTIRIGKSILNEYVHLDPWQRNLGIAGILLVGPSLWCYGKTVFHQSSRPKSAALHFIPYVLFLIFSPIIPNRADTVSLMVYYAVFVHLLVYIGLSTRLAIKKRSGAQQQILSWYRNLILGVGVIWIFYIGNVSGIIPFYIGGAICYTFLVYVFSFLLLKKHTFQLEKYEGHMLTKKVSENVFQSLKDLFQDEEVYLNPTINLSEIANLLDTTPKILSRVINETTGKNFSEFVNSYRIEKAKQLLTDPNSRQEKIASIAYDSGFNNVTSFNLAFKGMTQLTPTQFRKKSM